MSTGLLRFLVDDLHHMDILNVKLAFKVYFFTLISCVM